MATKLDETDAEEYNKRWENIWNGSESNNPLQPGQAFDAAKSSPALLNLLTASFVQETENKRVFVPGCGRGYDLITFIKQAKFKYAVGLELAHTAVAAAQKFITDSLESTDPDALHKIKVVEGDFFSWEDSEPFDVGYDYTFFCALLPSYREQWAKNWARHLKPGGLLITLIFPVDEDRDRIGPPWPVWPDLYKEILSNDFVLKSLEPVPADQSHPGRGGREMMAIWERT